MNFVYLLETETFSSVKEICTSVAMQNVLYLVGIIVLLIKVAVPIILIVVGMIDLLKAISQQDEKALKSATSALTKKAVAAVAVFLIATIVGLLMGLIGGIQYKDCMDCINHPFGECEPNFGGE